MADEIPAPRFRCAVPGCDRTPITLTQSRNRRVWWGLCLRHRDGDAGAMALRERLGSRTLRGEEIR